MGGFMMFDALKDALVLNQLGKANKHHQPQAETDDTPAGDDSDAPDPAAQLPDGKSKVVADDKLSEDFKKKHQDIIDSALQ